MGCGLEEAGGVDGFEVRIVAAQVTRTMRGRSSSAGKSSAENCAVDAGGGGVWWCAVGDGVGDEVCCWVWLKGQQ